MITTFREVRSKAKECVDQAAIDGMMQIILNSQNNYPQQSRSPYRFSSPNQREKKKVKGNFRRTGIEERNHSRVGRSKCGFPTFYLPREWQACKICEGILNKWTYPPQNAPTNRFRPISVRSPF